MISCLVMAVMACSIQTKQCVEIKAEPFKVVLTKTHLSTPSEVEDLQLEPTADGIIAVFKYREFVLSGPAVCKEGGSI